MTCHANLTDRAGPHFTDVLTEQQVRPLSATFEVGGASARVGGEIHVDYFQMGVFREMS